ncbi:hypothetical protein [Intestinibacter sp.]|uniref:hypothetical protein n=1 Tax=Intestinibacter sp. TaxID=1965304 RepID=UPI003F181E14
MCGSNASPTAFGWDYQVNVAIVLMLHHVKQAVNLRVEGKKEDIEITLSDGSKIYSQVKSVTKYDDYHNVVAYLKKALGTLNKASKDDNIHNLIYATNSPNPFNNGNESIVYFRDLTILNFDELASVDQERIKDLIQSNGFCEIELEKLQIVRIPFIGEDVTNRYKYIKNYISDFLSSLNIVNINISGRLMTVWQADCFHNASTVNTNVVMTKERFVWPIISVLLEGTSGYNYLNDLNIDDIEDIENKYRSYIDYQAMRYQLVASIIADYRRNNVSSDVYINNNWQKYKFISDDYPELEDCLRDRLIKVVLQRIIKNYKVITNVKAGVNL